MLFVKEAVMGVFDLHCDTLYRSLLYNIPIDHNSHQFRIKDLIMSDYWHQCLAFWTPDDYSEIPEKYHNRPLIDFFISGAELLISECERLGIPFNDKKANKSLHLTVENSEILQGKIENIDFLEKYGVKIATLTWNFSNCVGDGAKVESHKGATSFGKEVIKEYIKRNIAIDVSHASDSLFYDVASQSPKFILATHSNSRKVCNNLRNLTDEQFLYIKNSGGIVGLNFYKHFLDNDGKAGIKDILNHTYHFLSLGGEDTLAIGSDFDGADIPDEILNSAGLNKIYNSFIENKFEKSVVDKIFFKNASNFYDKL